ncbi:creatininase family protein [Synechococcus sp. RSCCF101]|uniref:creatininase family protein n=1 Tax=Synechococcus sp. RSCCF101 TaxID=2511069 RepID=UPI00124434E2|nr:creatininase family protein [Synechococcus sp. RSCCF101]QEY31361.1 creatininase family protein [Synechococcus sp. RSCCF101]
MASASWTDLAALANRAGSTAVWPMGALEQHGPHLPLATDAIFAERVCTAVVSRLDPDLPVTQLPTQVLGFSPEHASFPGTLTLPAELLIGIVVEVGRQLASMGFRRLVLLNAHGGQIALLQVAARQLRLKATGLGVLPCFLWSGPESIAGLIREPERSQGLHAGLAETSLMLHLAPDLVGEERPVDGLLQPPHAVGPPPGWQLEGAVPSAWLTEDLSRSGVIGDSRGAGADLGASLFEALVDGWHRRFDGLLRSDWPPLPTDSEARPGGPSSQPR